MASQRATRGFVATPALREDGIQNSRYGSIGGRGAPQCQHAVERELIDGLYDAGLLDLARDGTQAERIERDRSRRAQECQVAKLRIQLVIAHRKIAFDLLLIDQ